MKLISLLVYEDVVLSSVSGVIDLLNATNGYLESMGQAPAFRLELVSQDGTAIRLQGPASLISTRSLEEAQDTELILIPAFSGDWDGVKAKNTAALAWLQQQRGRGAELASLCMGAYFLAEAGLLNGAPVASHWLVHDDLALRFPEVEVLHDVVLTDRDGIYSSGGALLSWNLIVYLIEKFCGHEVSISVSRMFNLDLDRHSQRHFAVFRAQRSHADAAILEVQQYLEVHFAEELSVDALASRAAMSRRNFIRRFKAATHNTPQEYLQRVRMEAAKKALERPAEDVSGAMYHAGYNDAKAFRKIFKQVTGLTPQDYRKKYKRAEVTMV